MDKLVRMALGTVALVVLVVFGWGGWYYSDQALAPGVPGPQARDVEVVAVDDDTITLRSVGAPAWAESDLLSDIVVGFDHERGYLRLHGPARDVDEDRVRASRAFTVLTGNVPAVGDRGGLEIAALPDDPNFLDLGVQDVLLPADLGTYPAWEFTGDERADQWVVFVHGRGGSRHGALRAVEHVVGELGMSALVVTYRNDPGAPASPDGHGHFGDSEARDLQAWLGWLRRVHDPADVVLYGSSQGGSVVASCLRRCDGVGDVTRVVLDSPLLSLDETLQLQARNRNIPGPIIDPLLASAGFFMEARADGLELDRLEHVTALAEMDLPILVFHGTNDTTVPDSPSRALATLDAEQVVLVEHDGDHVRAWNVNEQRFDRALTDFLTQN